MSEKPKYIKVTTLQRANELSDDYTLRETVIYSYSDDMSGRIKTDVEYLLSLREESKYDNVEAFKRMPITDDWTDVPEGVEIIHHTSKEMIVTKKGKHPRLSVIREAIVNAYSAVENWDVKDGNLSNNILKALDVALDEIEGKPIKKGDEK